jgi:aspartate/methionine/tyrosine aminotransferase
LYCASGKLVALGCGTRDRYREDDLRYHKYGFQQGLPEFRQACSAFVEQRFGQQFDPMT